MNPCKPSPFAAIRTLLALVFLSIAPVAHAEEVEWQHAISVYEEAVLPKSYTHFPFANPEAPRGGNITYGVVGTFDSLNPFVLKSKGTTARGMWDPEFGKLVFEPLMTRSADEPFTLYGLLAEAVRMPEDRSWIEFRLDAAAKWADGKPVTPEDVIFTYEVLTESARPPFSTRVKRIDRIEKTGERTVKFTFNTDSDREFPLIIAGFTPVLPAHATDKASFADSTLIPPLGSGPYSIAKISAGQQITYERRSDYWGENVPANRGALNTSKIVVEYFGTQQTLFEAFKKGIVDIYFERDPANWQRAYDFPAVTDGRVKKSVFRTGAPATMQGFVFNTRRLVFSDRLVRKALSTAFDFETLNKSLYFGAYKRTASYWQGSILSSVGVPVDDTEKDLLGAFAAQIDPEVLQGTYLPQSTDGSGRDRKAMKAAFDLLTEAGFKRRGGSMAKGDAEPLAFEILIRSGSQTEEKLALHYQRTLSTLGVNVSIRSVDDAQYQLRLTDFDYDMVIASYATSLSPGIEQLLRWGSASRDAAGSFNYSGAADPAIDALIDKMLAATSAQDFQAAVRALDRLLISGHYLVPLFHIDEQWVAHWDRLAFADKTPMYGVQFPYWWDTSAK